MTQETGYQLDIITLTHGRQDLSMRCVRTIFRHTQTPFHLIVMDDSTPDMDEGTDMTPEWFAKFCEAHNNVTFVHSDKPFKNSHHIFSEAFKRCKTPYTAVVVNSFMVEPEWELAALQMMKQNPKIGMIGFKCLRAGTELIESAGLAIVANNSGLTDIGVGQSGHRFCKAYQCDAVQWAFVLLRVEAVAPNLGADIYHGFKGIEEFEHCLTMREKGWTIWYCGLGVGYHTTLATRLAKGEEDLRLNVENKELFFKRWGYWPKYHKASGIPELLPDAYVREKPLDPVMIIDTTGVMSQKVQRVYERTYERTPET